MNSTNPIPVIPVDMHGAPMLDAATGHPLVAAPVQQQQVLSQPVVKQSQVQYLAGGDMGLYTVQPGAPLQLMAQVPAMLAQQPQQQQVCVSTNINQTQSKSKRTNKNIATNKNNKYEQNTRYKKYLKYFLSR